MQLETLLRSAKSVHLGLRPQKLVVTVAVTEIVARILGNSGGIGLPNRWAAISATISVETNRVLYFHHDIEFVRYPMLSVVMSH